MGRAERRHFVSGIGMAAASGATPVPLSVGITFNGSTADASFNVSGSFGDTLAAFSEAFALSASGGSGTYTHLQYVVTSNVGQGYLTDAGHTVKAQGGTTVETVATLGAGWAVGSGDYLDVGQTCRVTVQAKVIDSNGTTAFGNSITVSMTRTS
jgi:hypothetical protein